MALGSYENAFAKRLEKALKEMADGKANQIIDGRATDFPEYRERVGYLRACGDMLGIMKEVRDEMNGDKS